MLTSSGIIRRLLFGLSLMGMIILTGRLAMAQPTVVPPFDSEIEASDLSDTPNYKRGHVPPRRTTRDGRIGVYRCGSRDFCFVPINPEKIQTGQIPLSLRTGLLTGTAMGFAPLGDGSGGLRDPALCDAREDADKLGFEFWTDESQNPYRCGTSGEKDCYDLTLLFIRRTNVDELLALPIRVEVTNPKTSSVAVSAVTEVGLPVTLPVDVMTAAFPGTTMESPTVTGDGRLLVIDGGDGDETWGGGLLYSYNSDPCDVSGWRTFAPVTGMFEDPALPSFYGVAAHPLRDTEDGTIASGETLKGKAPWIDRAGSNLFFAYARGSDMPAGSIAVYTDNLDVLTEADIVDGMQDDTLGLGVSFFGLWSSGKIVHVDQRFNRGSVGLSFTSLAAKVEEICTNSPIDCDAARSDLATIQADENAGNSHVTIEAYAPVVGIDMDGIDIGGTIVDDIGSPGREFNYIGQMQPVSTRDVVKLISDANVTDEVDFDEYVHGHTLISSSMVPTIGTDNRFRDGLGSAETHVQNASTIGFEDRSRLIPPPFGVLGSLGPVIPRIEPIAVGGVRGRGIYLEDDDFLSYQIESEFDDDRYRPNQQLHVSIWLRPKADLVGGKRVLTFTRRDDDSVRTWVNLSADEIVVGQEGLSDPFVFPIPPSLKPTLEEWIHLGFIMRSSEHFTTVTNLAQGMDGNDNFEEDVGESGETILRIFVNGTLIHKTGAAESYPERNETLFRLHRGEIRVGAPAGESAPGFSGWIDDFKVIPPYPNSHNEEEMCNLAYGTLVGVEDPSSHPIAGAIAPEVHDVITKMIRLGPHGRKVYSGYYCEVLRPLDVRRGLAPATECKGALDASGWPQRDRAEKCVGKFVLFPEGPLTSNRERPFSGRGANGTGRQNRFCLNCHTHTHSWTTLHSDSSLGYYDGDRTDCENEARHDRRRQVHQTPRSLFGTFPPYLGGGPGCTGPSCELDPIFLPEASLMGYWRFDNLIDDYSRCLDVEAPSGMPTFNFRGSGRALDLTGDTYLRISPPDGRFDFDHDSELTFAFWIKANIAENHARFVVAKSRGLAMKGYSVFLSSGRHLVFEMTETNTANRLRANIQTGVADGSWHHVAVTYNGLGGCSGVVFYLDGNGPLSGVGTNCVKDDLSGDSILNSEPLAIGATSPGFSRMKGRLDDLRVYNRVLSEEEIAELAAR